MRTPRFARASLFAAAIAAASALGASMTVRAGEPGDVPVERVGWRVHGPAKVDAIPGKPVDVPITIEVLKNHHIFQDHTKFTTGATKAKVGDVRWPDGVMMLSIITNTNVVTYRSGSHVFPVPVTLDPSTAAGTTDVTLDVKSQACNEDDPPACLFPHVEHVPVHFVIAAAKPAATPTKHAAASPAPTASAAATSVARATPPHAASATPAAIASATPVSTAAILAATPPPSHGGDGSDGGSSLAGVFRDENRMAALIGSRFLLALLIAFVGGLGISLTPCVYPMIPITISIIGAHSTESRSKGFFLSLVYVAGICIVYSALALVAGLSGREFGFLLQSPWIRLGIAVIFVALAASMFGAWNLELPSPIATRLSTYKGNGVTGVFVTGLFSGLVAGPCTAPVLLGILTAISTGLVGAAAGFALMLSFSLGMGVLFVVIGTFSGLLASLPRSGAWMVRVKHVFGFLLLGAALYYARISVPPWAFALLLGAVLVFAGVHLGAGTRLEPEPSELQRLGKAAGLVSVTAGLYFVVAGMLTSGYGPAGLDAFPLARAGSGALTPVAVATAGTDPAGAGEIPWVTDAHAAQQTAAASGKPMLFDFWADWCEDCKALDKDVYSDPRVVAEAKNFVAVKVDTSVHLDTSEAEQARIDALKKRYRVLGLPRVLFLRPDGRVIEGLSFTGKVEADDMLQHMSEALDSASKPCTSVTC